MKASELKGLSKQSLVEKLTESRLELMKVDVQLSMGTDPKLSGKIQQLKKTIARILTILNQKNNEDKA